MYTYVHICIHAHINTYIYIYIYMHTVKRLKPTISTDRPLPYIDCFISVPKDHPYQYSNSANRPLP